MKEQWKKHDSDAKLLQNVEEGRPQPIKIELPISAFALKQDGCCNRLITLLRVAILFVLLIILSWTAVTLYSNYSPRQLEIDEKTEQLIRNQHDYSSEENKLSFRNKVYAMSDMKDNVVSNEIDTPIAISTDPSIIKSKLTKDSDFNDDEVRSILEFLQMKNSAGIRVIDIIPKQDNDIKNKLQIIENERITPNEYIFKGQFNSEPNLEPYLPNQNVYANIPALPIFNFQEVREATLVNKEDDSQVNNQVYDKMFNSPDKELDTDKKDSIEVSERKFISGVNENKGIEVVIPGFEDEDTPKFVKNFESDVDIGEVDDVEELFRGIADAMGLLDEPSSEMNQSNEESVAVIPEEIKNNEENLEIVDLSKVSSTEEQSTEESVRQEEITGTSEEPEPITESVAVIQVEIKNKSEESTEEEYEVDPFLINEQSEDDFSTEKSQEKINSEDSSLDDFDKNIGLHIFSSTVNMLRNTLLSSETVSSSSMEIFKLDTIQSVAAIIAKVLEPLVGQNYELVHWYYNIFLGANFGYLFNDQILIYAAKVLYNQNVGEYDTDMQMFLNEISKDSYYLNFPDLVHPQKQVLADTFLQKQIVDKLVMKLILKRQYDLNMITFEEVWEKIGQSNSNHIKSWLLATHPSVRDKNLEIVSSMYYRRALYPMIKKDLLAVKNEFTNEDNDLSLLNLNADDFDEEPKPSNFEKLLVLGSTGLRQLSEQEKVDKPVENASVDTKLTSDYVPDNENESIDDEYLVQQLHQVVINAMKEVGKEFDYSEEKFLETTEKPEERLGEDSDFNYSASNEKSSEDNDSNDSALNEKSVIRFTINPKFIYFLSKKLEPIVGPNFELVEWYHNNYDPNRELEKTQNNLSAYTGKLLFETDIRTFYETLNIVSRLVMNDSNTAEYEKIIADDLDLTVDTDMQYYILDILKNKLKFYDIWENQGNAALNDIFVLNTYIYDSVYQHYSDITKKSSQVQIMGSEDSSFISSAQSSSDEFIPMNQRVVQAIKEVEEEYEQTEEPAEDTMVSVLKNHDAEGSVEETTGSVVKNHDDTKESVEESTGSVVKNHDDTKESVEETTVSVLKNHDTEESVEETTISVVENHNDNVDTEYGLKVRTLEEESLENFEEKEEEEYQETESNQSIQEETEEDEAAQDPIFGIDYY